MTTSSLACSVKGSDTGTMPEAEICALFQEAFRDSRATAVTIDVSEGGYRAAAIATAPDGSVLAELMVASMDRKLSRSTWDQLARDMLAQVSQK
ncbi:hypothetical protein [Qipengyuania marisflavi]|uniref:hypothetical protein n=1 Tax=Qipengyuania marisflavi TaxID=2486356 RepID=UPI00148644CC|nr:hypothetical protein [Qipengyuania marisflavi]